MLLITTLLIVGFLIGFIVDVFLIKPPSVYTDWASDVRFLVPLILWLVVGKIARFKSSSTFILCTMFLAILSFLFIFFRDHQSIERLASWVYIYLATGVVQQFVEGRKRRS